MVFHQKFTNVIELYTILSHNLKAKQELSNKDSVKVADEMNLEVVK